MRTNENRAGVLDTIFGRVVVETEIAGYAIRHGSGFREVSKSDTPGAAVHAPAATHGPGSGHGVVGTKNGLHRREQG